MQHNKVGELKLFKLFGLFNFIFLLSTSALMAQSFEDFKHSQTKEFRQYRDARDSAFGSYLKAAWQEYRAKESPSLYSKPKPKSLISTPEQKIKSLGPKVSIKIPKLKKIIQAALKKESVSKKISAKDIHFIFFGTTVGVNIDKKILKTKFYPQNQTGISNFFQTIASSDYEETLRDIHAIAKEYKLNDWAIYLLVRDIAQNMYEYPNEQKLFEWFVFNKLGYEVKVGLGAKHIVLMFYSKKLIYSTPIYNFGKKKYYVVGDYAKESVGRVYSYKQNYPDANKALNLSLNVLPSFKENLKKKTVSFKEFGKRYSATFEYDQNLIDFMATYPQADYGTFFNAPMNRKTYQDIASDIKKYINAKSSSVAIDFVLNFVQKAFVYETDQQQFGHEKVMFAEETLYYDKSDCEDRAVLFSYLVKELFGISVVGVKYKDHMATALYIPMRGDAVKVNGRRFVIADPTYINANIGQSMPQYKSIEPESFIVVRKSKI